MGKPLAMNPPHLVPWRTANSVAFARSFRSCFSATLFTPWPAIRDSAARAPLMAISVFCGDTFSAASLAAYASSDSPASLSGQSGSLPSGSTRSIGSLLA